MVHDNRVREPQKQASRRQPRLDLPHTARGGPQLAATHQRTRRPPCLLPAKRSANVWLLLEVTIAATDPPAARRLHQTALQRSTCYEQV